MADDDKVCALLNFYRKIYRIVGCVIFALGLVLLPFVRSFINGDVPSDINVYVLYLVFLLNTIIGYFAFAYKILYKAGGLYQNFVNVRRYLKYSREGIL